MADETNAPTCRDPRGRAGASEIAGMTSTIKAPAPPALARRPGRRSGSVFVGPFRWIRGMCPDLGFVELGIALGGRFAVDAVFLDVVFVAVDA